MAEDDLNDMGLEAFFAAGRGHTQAPSDALMARVLADAEAEMVRPAVAVAVISPRPAPRPGWLASAIAAIGGWAGLGGLATATAAGVWIGFAGLADSLGASGLAAPSLSVELMPEADGFLTASAQE